ncbi:MAG: Re/Si-specific NAD(P)(+) transhydrogenase subunit alpha [Magnetococcales bacterium]|nr:Re/Si-specific NAD(P)(+) transhydrogenase subunit alpha [Magnetococcales bacterium]MBF0322971.1 Re/Si-specific NAD(P)(+) transhydrogenase subunit alpha [Magnetococcales bacterium]
MKIGIPKEIYPGENRVAASPDSVRNLIKLGFTVAVESGAGNESQFLDAHFKDAGAEILPDAGSVWQAADILFKVRAPMEIGKGKHEADLLREGCTLIGFIWPAQNKELMDRLASRKVNVLAMDSVPRISRAQKLDALSSMANIAGYRAVVEAAHAFGRFFTGQVTAAGKVPPAKVFVIGAGVAGLAAIGAASGMGAIVRATDTRPEVKDQVKSMGAEFVSPPIEEEGTGVGGYAKVMSEAYQKAQLDMTAKQVAEVDIVITTALIPGKPAPKLVTEAMVDSMKPGSVIVDLAAEQGGNCAYTVPHQKVVHNDVTIIGYADLPSRLARQSSQLYATNLLRLTEELCKTKDGVIHINMDDEVIRGTTVIKDGIVTWPPPPPRLSAAPQKPAAAQTKTVAKPESKGGHGHGAGEPTSNKSVFMTGLAGAVLFGLIGMGAPASFLGHFTVFVLACFIGYMVIWNVTPALHTPLMSVTNAISSIIIIGALIQISSPGFLITLLAGLAIGLTAVNMFGGFWVTRRMLRMFQR